MLPQICLNNYKFIIRFCLIIIDTTDIMLDVLRTYMSGIEKIYIKK
ncbi:protein of unknown function [Tepidibacter aestuarii]|nr:protein of unknown function [Tepidibacter aestuarii]